PAGIQPGDERQLAGTLGPGRIAHEQWLYFCGRITRAPDVLELRCALRITQPLAPACADYVRLRSRATVARTCDTAVAISSAVVKRPIEKRRDACARASAIPMARNT